MPSSTERQPMRTCVGCRRVRPSAEMHRVTLESGRGRGAWLCDIDCFDTAAKHRGFNRAYRQSIDEPVVTALRARFTAH